MSQTKIEWTEHSWNPITGCSHAGSPGCDNCYAKRMARRLAGRCGYPEAPHQFDVTLHPDRLDIPLKRKKPTTYFVCSMSDLFHERVPPSFVCEVWDVMRKCPQHTFQCLSKRPMRRLRLIKTYIADDEIGIAPLFNVWQGVSIENQAMADKRMPILLQTPAAVHFVSLEPLLERIELAPEHMQKLDWIITGAESGPGARPMNEDWVRDIRDQCQAAGVPFFYKQKLANGKKISLPMLDGRTWNEMPNVAQK